MRNYIFKLLTFLFLFSLSISTKGQDNIYGKYCYWHIVHGHCLEIKSSNDFILTESGYIYPEPPSWSGKWSLIGDTITLVFDIDSMGPYTHIIESEYLIRTNLKKHIINKDTFQFESPRYLYKKIGYYENGNLQSELNWQNIASFNSTPTPVGPWNFYYINGILQRTENYRKGKLHGEIVNYDENGKCIKIEKWRNGKLKKTIY